MNSLFKVSEIKLTYQPHFKPSERPKIKKSTQAYEVLRQHWDEEIMQFLEEFKVILLNTAKRVLGIVDISLGGLMHVSVDIKVVIAVALKAGATGMILAHNHPSGTLKPSSQDIALTRKIFDAAKLFDIEVLDHIIITSEGFYSFSDNWMMPR